LKKAALNVMIREKFMRRASSVDEGEST